MSKKSRLGWRDDPDVKGSQPLKVRKQKFSLLTIHAFLKEKTFKYMAK